MSWDLTCVICEKCLALTNLLVFISFGIQMHGLIGSQGITPLKEVMKGKTWRGLRNGVTLFFYSDSDNMINVVWLGGVVSALLALFGVFPVVMMAMFTICYESFHVVSDMWMGLQMHSNITELNVLYVMSGPFLRWYPFTFICVNWALLFRTMLGGGAGKYLGNDPSWKDKTAMKWHYWTQPLPNPLSGFMHAMPNWFHAMEVFGTYVVEGPTAILIYLGWHARLVAFVAFLALLILINATGHFGHLWMLTLIESFTLLDDSVWCACLTPVDSIAAFLLGSTYVNSCHGLQQAATDDSTIAHFLSTLTYVALGVGAVVFAAWYNLLSWVSLLKIFDGKNPLEWPCFTYYSTRPLHLWQQLTSRPFVVQIWPWLQWLHGRGNQWLSNDTVHMLRLGGKYVKFASMTKWRWEIIVEGSDDGDTWREYDFVYKPSSVTKRPPWFLVVPGHMPSLDWRLWFLPHPVVRRHLRAREAAPEWFNDFLLRLLQGSPSVLRLLKVNPFPVHPPRYVRALLYDYRFSHEAPPVATEAKKGVHWWRKEFCGQFGRTQTLQGTIAAEQ